MKINRREFVGGLTAIAVGSSLPSFAAVPRTVAKTVDVYFHGLWVFVDMGGVLKAYAPGSMMHCYMIGRDSASLVDLDPGSYSFSIPTAPGSARFDSQSNKIDSPPPGMSALSQVDRTVTFPHQPRAIQSARPGSALYKSGETSPYSLVEKLTFDFDQPTVSFGSTWTSDATRKTDTLHLFAEAASHETGNHALLMMNAVATMLNLPWQLSRSTLPAKTTDPKLMGLPELKIQCKSPGKCSHPLDSMRSHAKSARSSTVANCMPVIIGG
jgi:hypothetical protein